MGILKITAGRALAWSGAASRPAPTVSGMHRQAATLRAMNAGIRWHCDSVIDPDAASVSVTFVDAKGVKKSVTGKEGQNIVNLAHENDIELEGACECSLACSTCHVILDEKVYDRLEAPCEEEEDLLDLAFGLTATSRLGCQVKLTKAMQGSRIELPSATRNFYVDGHKPKPH